MIETRLSNNVFLNVSQGFGLEKGLTPVVNIFLQGMLMATDADDREASADGLRELVEVTTPEAVKPHVTAIVGPLIRIARDKFTWQASSKFTTVFFFLHWEATLLIFC